MGVAVINPRDCLSNSSFPQRLSSPLPKIKVFKAHPTSNPKPNRTSRGRPNNHPKRTPFRPHDDSRPTRSLSPSTVKPPQLNQPVMGQIKILKRGELLKVAHAPAPAIEQTDRVNVDLGSTDRMGPNPEKVPVEGLAGFYAGSSMFVASPPPSSVPLPAFFTKKAVSDATTDLRRILRLDLQ